MAKNGTPKWTHEDVSNVQDDRQINWLEETILRLRHGLGSAQVGGSYEKRAIDDETHQRLLLLELRALQEAGRLDETLATQNGYKDKL